MGGTVMLEFVWAKPRMFTSSGTAPGYMCYIKRYKMFLMSFWFMTKRNEFSYLDRY